MWLKKSRCRINEENRDVGSRAERMVKDEYESRGWKMKKVHKGRDFIATKTDPFTGEKMSKEHEIKTGRSKLTKRQKQRMKHLGSRYVLHRFARTMFGLYKVSEIHSSEKQPTKESWFGKSDSWFGPKKKSKNSSKSDS